MPVQGSEFEIPADALIIAIGEAPDVSSLGGGKFVTDANGCLVAHKCSKVTNVAGIFACGDVVTGPATVIEAVAAGQKAAIGVDRFLRGEPLDYDDPSPAAIPIEDVETERFRKRERQNMLSLPAESNNRLFCRSRGRFYAAGGAGGSRPMFSVRSLSKEGQK